MCFFVLAILPDEPSAALLRPLTSRLALKPLENATLREQLTPRDRCFITATSMCDCGSFLGSAHSSASRHRVTANKLAQLERKGWGRKKIDEWVKTQEALQQGRLGANTDECAAWRAWFQAVLDGRVPSLAILPHQSRGDLSLEQITLKRTEKLSVDAVDDRFLASLHDGVLYRVTRSAA